ncbi:MAG TPA: NUDIX domain-containing protein [Dehalococcoidia bacterium]|nr:NUDIX domain-containing protein [Dehalococcoidia bacterium]
MGLITAGDGRLLLQHRDDRPDVSGAGLWGFFGGHLEPGERAAAAFLREMEEELGWRPTHFEDYLTTDAPPLPGDGGYGLGVVSHVFAAHLDVELDRLTLNEGQAMGLFAPDALPARIVPGLAPVIEEFTRSRAYGRVRRAWDMISTTGLIVDSKGRFLLQLRDDRPDIVNPGLWGSFGGRVEPHETGDPETPYDGFLREMREELHWEPRVATLYDGFSYRSLDATDPRTQLIYVYASPLDVPLHQLELGEGTGMDVFPPEALPARIVPALRGLIERFTNDRLYAETQARAIAAPG